MWISLLCVFFPDSLFFSLHTHTHTHTISADTYFSNTLINSIFFQQTIPPKYFDVLQYGWRNCGIKISDLFIGHFEPFKCLFCAAYVCNWNLLHQLSVSGNRKKVKFKLVLRSISNLNVTKLRDSTLFFFRGGWETGIENGCELQRNKAICNTATHLSDEWEKMAKKTLESLLKSNGNNKVNISHITFSLFCITCSFLLLHSIEMVSIKTTGNENITFLLTTVTHTHTHDSNFAASSQRWIAPPTCSGIVILRCVCVCVCFN